MSVRWPSCAQLRQTAITLALCLAASGTARASNEPISLTGRLGGVYLLSSDDVAGLSSNGSLFGLNASLGLTGGYFNPRFLRWSAGADYDLLRGQLFSAPSAFDRLGFRAAALLLGGTPFNLNLTAGRYFTDSSVQGTGPNLGNTVTTLYGGTASLRQQRLPSARIGLSRQDSTTTLLGSAPTRTGNTRLSLGVAQALSKFEYGVHYDTNWSDGTFADLNYHAHTLLVNMAAPLAEDVRFNLFDNYYLRYPTVTASTNPRYDTNALGAGIQWRHTARQNSSFTYNYNHELVDAPTLPVAERSAHVLGGATRRLVSDSVFLLGSLSATSAQSRLATVRTDALGQSLGLGGEWQGTYDWGDALASSTLTLGLVEPSTGGVRFVHGVAASGQYSRAWDRLGTSLQYIVSYDNGSALVDGWTLTQQARLEGTWKTDPKSRLRGLLTAYAGRRDAGVLGVSLGRNLSLILEYLSRVYSAQLSGGISDGLAGSLTNPISDGLFLPAAFNTHTQYAALGGSASFDRGRLTLALNARLANVEAPGRPAYSESGFQLLASYTLGKFVFTVEERFAIGGPAGSRQQTNLFMLRAARMFDWQFGTGR